MSNLIIQLLASDKFSDEGYSNWKSNINTILVVVDLRWVRASEKSRAYILTSIYDVLNKKHEVMPIAHEIMASLQEMFGQPSSSVRHKAIKYVYVTRMKDGTNIREYVLDMMVHFSVAKAHRMMIDETSQTHQSMMKLKEKEINVISKPKKFYNGTASRTKPIDDNKSGPSSSNEKTV
ncbi:uncharacterized protein LOC120090657 [Benincasa hispida]|uniref:uncharacterized protein LOC120090657 n=1 Tax=Benincasa hispida TaxID=102211 RepID=UPI0019001B51|nr:uncharacterized protein LOC120090657 [Benincasa hispida]